jgi:tyrosyl-tRNA synthetase
MQPPNAGKVHMGFLETMRDRGMIAQITHEDELTEHLGSGRRTAYIGFDPTATSLHIGHMMTIMGLRRWQQAGHRVIALVGGGTALIGDPTGKSDMRQMLTQEQVRANMEGIKLQLGKFLDFSSPDRGIMVNNADWLASLNYLALLREVGPHFSVNRMLTAECFRQRLEKGLSFLEFNYMILQSYDFLHLFRAEQCTVQMGGDDQWSNILGGMELVRRLGGGKAFCLTYPLLTTSDGKKMGKTEKGAVWLDPQLTTAYEYFQFWRNVEDAKVADCLAYFTELPMDEVRRLAALTGSLINDAKVVLAFEATKMLHGEAAAAQARESASSLFTSGAASTGSEPVHYLTAEQAGTAVNIMDAVCLSGIVESKGEARRLITQGGLTVDGEKVTDLSYTIDSTGMRSADGVLIRKGKKHYYRLKISD